jgi:hypothetical protein
MHTNCVAREHIDDWRLQGLAESMHRTAQDYNSGGTGDGLSPRRTPGSVPACYVRLTDAPETKYSFFIGIRADGDDVHFFIDDDVDRLMCDLRSMFPNSPILAAR